MTTSLLNILPPNNTDLDNDWASKGYDSVRRIFTEEERRELENLTVKLATHIAMCNLYAKPNGKTIVMRMHVLTQCARQITDLVKELMPYTFVSDSLIRISSKSLGAAVTELTTISHYRSLILDVVRDSMNDVTRLRTEDFSVSDFLCCISDAIIQDFNHIYIMNMQGDAGTALNKSITTTLMLEKPVKFSTEERLVMVNIMCLLYATAYYAVNSHGKPHDAKEIIRVLEMWVAQAATQAAKELKNKSPLLSEHLRVKSLYQLTPKEYRGLLQQVIIDAEGYIPSAMLRVVQASISRRLIITMSYIIRVAESNLGGRMWSHLPKPE